MAPNFTRTSKFERFSEPVSRAFHLPTRQEGASVVFYLYCNISMRTWAGDDT